MKISIAIYPDTRYSTEYPTLYARMRWTDENGIYKDTRKSTGWKIDKADWSKRIKEFLFTPTGSRDSQNIRTNIIGTSQEATRVRSQVCQLIEFVRTLNQPTTAKSMSAIERFIDNLNGTQTMNMESLSDFIEKFISTKNNAYSYNRIRSYKTLLRNLLLFCSYKKYSDLMFEMSRDKQVVFFSQYVDFLLKTTVLWDGENLTVDGKVLKQTEALSVFLKDSKLSSVVKKTYENSSVKQDFTLLAAVCKQFETGVSVELNDFHHFLKTGDTKGTFLTIDEITAIWRTPRRTLTEEKTISTFIFNCFTGLRTNELYQVEEANITNRMVGTKFIKVLTYELGKEGNRNTVPLNTICLNILKEWSEREFKKPEKRNPKTKVNQTYPNCLLPLINFSEMNETLHEFLKRVPGMDRVSKRVRYVNSEPKEELIPRWQEITMYAARHSYSRLLSEGGISIDEGGQLLGHQSGETTRKNYKHLNEDLLIGRSYEVMEGVV